MLLLIGGCSSSDKKNNGFFIAEHFKNIERSLNLELDFEELVEQMPDSLMLSIMPLMESLDEHIVFVDSIKAFLAENTGNQDVDLSVYSYAYVDAYSNLNDYKAPSDLLIGDDPSSPHDKNFGAKNLQEKLEALNLFIINELEEKGVKLIRTQIFVADYIDQDVHVMVPWHLANFYYLSLGQVFGNLSEIQVQINATKIQILDLVNCNAA